MAILYVASTGSDSPAGANATAKLAVVATPAGAMKTLSALAALLNTYFTETGTVYCTGSTEIVLSGIIQGTTSAPDAAYCYFNGAVCGSPGCFRQWEEADGSPPSGPILSWGANGGVPVNPTWTYGAVVATAWGSSALPAAITATNANAVYVLRNTGTNATGQKRMHLTRASSAANSGFAVTPNAWFISAGRVLTLNFTDMGGTNITALPPGLDTNDANVFVIVTPAAGGVGTGTGPGALLFLDRIDRADGGECVVSGGTFSNTGYPATGGCYCVCTERCNRVIIRNSTAKGVSHHGFGHGGTSNQETCKIDNCITGPFFGAAATGHYSIGASGKNVTGASITNCTFVNQPVSNPVSNALPEAATLANGVCNIQGINTTDTYNSIDIDDCVFQYPYVRGQNSTNGTINTAYTAAVGAADVWNPRSYPIRYRRPTIGPLEIGSYGVVGTNDHGNTSLADGVLMLTGGGGRTSTLNNLVNFNLNAGAWGIAVPDPLPRTLFLSKMIVLIDAGDPYSYQGTILFAMQTNNAAMCLRADQCLFLNIGQPMRNQTCHWFDYTNAAGNCGFFIRNSILCNLYADTGSRNLLRSDSALANASTRRYFSGNQYINFSAYSADTSYDTAAEFGHATTGIDTTATFATGLAITGTTFENRLKNLLGRGFMGGADPMAVLRQSMNGGPVTAASTSGFGRAGRSGR